MEYNIKVTKTLVADNNRKFSVGEDIFFKLYNKEHDRYDNYIGEITKIEKKSIELTRLEINKNREKGSIVVRLEDIEPNSCNYVYYD